MAKRTLSKTKLSAKRALGKKPAKKGAKVKSKKKLPLAKKRAKKTPVKTKKKLQQQKVSRKVRAVRGVALVNPAEVSAAEMGCCQISYFGTTIYKRMSRRDCERYPENYPTAETTFHPGNSCPPAAVAPLSAEEAIGCCEISYMGDTFHKQTTRQDCMSIPENYPGATVSFTPNELCPANFKPASEMDEIDNP